MQSDFEDSFRKYTEINLFNLITLFQTIIKLLLCPKNF